MLTTRLWGGMAVLLCALLLQNCQSSSLSVIEAKGAAGTPPQAGLGLAAHQPQGQWQAVVQDSSIQRTSQAGAHIQNTSQEAPEERKPPAVPTSAQDSSTISPRVWLEPNPVLLQPQRSPKRPRTEESVVGSAPLESFGAKEWKHHFGDVRPAPALPGNINAILDSACPFWPGRKVRDTHLLVLMPATVDGAPFTLNLLGELIQRPKNSGHETKYRYYSSDTKAQFSAASPDRSYWLLMTRDVLEGSRNKAYSDQKALVESHASRTGQPYAMLRALEAATAILMHHANTGERLFGDSPYTYTRCQELEDGKYPVVVGGFESSGLVVSNNVYDNYDDGVAGCRRFSEAQNLQSLRVPDIVFGEVEWKHYFGDVGSAPALPSNINAILDSACPFWPDKKVKDTHLLVLMPATVDGAPFTLNLLGELIQRPKNGGHETRYRYYDNDVKAQFGAASPDHSCWLLMTRDVLEGSRSKPYSDQKALVASYTGGDGHPYEVPGALEAATAILMYHARTGERLFGDAPLTYTRCQELADGKYPVVVGGFVSSGLSVCHDLYDRSSRGVAGCRKFSEAQNLQSLRVPDIVFGAKEWKHHFGDVGSAPALPGNINAILDSACPFWPGRKVRNTHLLVLMPATVDGAPFTLNLLGELIQRSKNGGHETRYRYYDNDVQAQFGAASPDHSYWLLMTRDVLEGSRSKSYSAQRALVARHASRTGHPYAIPGALEAATAILMHHARTKERLFGDDPRTYTRCQELADGKDPVVVGGFESSGLRVSSYDYGRNCSGVAGCRRF